MRSRVSQGKSQPSACCCGFLLISLFALGCRVVVHACPRGLQQLVAAPRPRSRRPLSNGFSFARPPTQGPQSVIYVVPWWEAGIEHERRKQHFLRTQDQNLEYINTVHARGVASLLIVDFSGGSTAKFLMERFRSQAVQGTLKLYVPKQALHYYHSRFFNTALRPESVSMPCSPVNPFSTHVDN